MATTSYELNHQQPLEQSQIRIESFHLTGVSRSGLIVLIVGAGLALLTALLLLIVGTILITQYVSATPNFLEAFNYDLWQMYGVEITLLGGLFGWFLISGIMVLIFAALALNKKGSGITTTAGILGIIMGFAVLGLIGGILTLAGNTKN